MKVLRLKTQYFYTKLPCQNVYIVNPNVHIHTFRKRWRFIWACSFPLSILEHLWWSVLAKIVYGIYISIFFVKSYIVNIGQGPKYAYSFTRNWWPLHSSSDLRNCLLENFICYSSFLGTEAYLEPSRTFTTELFWENSKQFLSEKAPLQMFDQVRNTPLVHVMGVYCFGNPYTLSFLYRDKIERNV